MGDKFEIVFPGLATRGMVDHAKSHITVIERNNRDWQTTIPTLDNQKSFRVRPYLGNFSARHSEFLLQTRSVSSQNSNKKSHLRAYLRWLQKIILADLCPAH